MADLYCFCLSGCLQLSPEYRKAEPGMFNLLFGGEALPCLQEKWYGSAVAVVCICSCTLSDGLLPLLPMH